MIEPKCGEYWWVKIKITPPLLDLPYEKGQIRLARVVCLGSGDEPFSVKLIDCVSTKYLQITHVEFVEKINKPEA